MNKKRFLIILGLSLLAGPAFAVEFTCTGQEKGVNTLTGKETVLPVKYRIKIFKNHATISDFDKIMFNATENKKHYLLKASIGKRRLLGEYSFRITKHTGRFESKSWLFSRKNMTTAVGSCEKIKSLDATDRQ
ncbi:hypothetical protein [Acidihalobacter prosperus]